jgi:hypothetical protein
MIIGAGVPAVHFSNQTVVLVARERLSVAPMRRVWCAMSHPVYHPPAIGVSFEPLSSVMDAALLGNFFHLQQIRRPRDPQWEPRRYHHQIAGFRQP